jgi:hypothetical protein
MSLARRRAAESRLVSSADSAKATDLTHRYVEAKRRASARTVHDLVILGQILEEGASFFRRKYLLWLHFLGEVNTTASRYRHIARLAREDRRLLKEWAFLGSSKVYWIARLPPEARARVLSPFRKAALAQMTEPAFRALIRPLLPRRNRSAERDLSDLCRRVRSTLKALLTGLPKGASPRTRRKLATALMELEATARKARRRIA